MLENIVAFMENIEIESSVSRKKLQFKETKPGNISLQNAVENSSNRSWNCRSSTVFVFLTFGQDYKPSFSYHTNQNFCQKAAEGKLPKKYLKEIILK